ncbi:CDP-glucose 4,6-dehydratase [Granulicella tundricola]|uniref:CDP-glucose 4,6-dehydratase n=1 Tax=Granulicella tundricola (strain ATCC BAA-1859 / DSM 23138 / MP5ACTX9) TaxID=1198114 RepID=E8X538_GRATM|nr:CDP-glucose 4,6-dehydratase [Granulicella tundricola]ADW67230.1 CDP-glucose 4,6-dehydratase [Granulicella tundricola MP5ACTX9]
MEDLVSTWRGRRVFLTGHTGFKGGWLALWLSALGANVRGYALDPEGSPNLFDTLRLGERIEDIRGDIRNPATLEPALRDFAPEVVFHLAAQPLVRASYADPIGTYETNVLGTARVLDAVRRTPSVRAIVSVTTDKVYENRETLTPYRESDPLGGYDPYSSSKACAEIVTAAYRQSYGVPVVTARAGNVIGGGDWSSDRLLPDLVRGFLSGLPVPIRHPHAIRPWQHVLDPLHGYLLLVEQLLAGEPKSFAYNFGPSETDARPVSWIADHMTASWGAGASWRLDGAPSVHEAGYLKLDASKAHEELNWKPRLGLPTALDWLISWYRAHAAGEEMQAFTLAQIHSYEGLSGLSSRS